MQRFIVLFICALVWSVNAGAASPNDEVTAQVTKFIDSFNKGDIKAARATHTENGVVIIDEVAPYLWQGNDSFKTWLDDLGKHDKARGITDGKADARFGRPASKSKAIAPMSSTRPRTPSNRKASR